MVYSRLVELSYHSPHKRKNPEIGTTVQTVPTTGKPSFPTLFQFLIYLPVTSILRSPHVIVKLFHRAYQLIEIS